MGTTRTAIEASAGVRLAYCLLIEGYDTAIVSDVSLDWATAYAATDWSASTNFAGTLKVPGEISSKINLFRGDIDAPGLRLSVYPDDNDTLGVDMFATAKSTGNESLLSTDLPASGAASAADHQPHRGRSQSQPHGRT